jgi:hypothetical protein
MTCYRYKSTEEFLDSKLIRHAACSMRYGCAVMPGPMRSTASGIVVGAVPCFHILTASDSALIPAQSSFFVHEHLHYPVIPLHLHIFP